MTQPPTHEHRVADPASWPWLPKSRGGPMAVHPFCADCGLIRSVGADRPLDLGGLVNLVSELADRLDQSGRHLTQVQKRLVLQRLRAREVDDTFGRTRTQQFAIVCQTVGDAIGMSAQAVHTYLPHRH